MGTNQQKQLWLFSGLLWLVSSASPAMAAPFYGVSKAIDGDSLMVGNKEVRLFGIDAPEFNQTCKRSGEDWACGAEAADRLSQLVTGKDVRCTQLGTDQHGRTLARCSVGATDINRAMVATGYAVAFRRYSIDYVSAEESAKLSKRGIWAGTFEMPQQYRNEPDPIPVPVARSSGELPVVVNAWRATSGGVGRGCNIKGNHSRRGEKIYHLPGRPYYNETVAEEMFCTEAQARAAGYRRSRAH